VISDLAASESTRSLAAWLQTVAYERFRVRVTVVPAEKNALDAETDATTTRERVVREDLYHRIQAAAQFVGALLEPARAPVVEALESRGLDRAFLVKLGQDASRIAETLGGKALLTPSSATQKEAEAVVAQKARWSACRRMIRTAIQGDGELLQLWASC
jgi:hypothetical protein